MSAITPETPDTEVEGNRKVARSTIEVLTPGTTTLKLNNPSSLRLWLNRREIKDPAAPLKLEKGRHEFLFHRDKKSNLRLEFTTPAGSSIKLQPEGGV